VTEKRDAKTMQSPVEDVRRRAETGKDFGDLPTLGGCTAKARGKGRGIFSIKVNCTNTRFLATLGMTIKKEGLVSYVCKTYSSGCHHMFAERPPPAVIICLQTTHQKAEQPDPSEASG
jgi:hypothetical protein